MQCLSKILPCKKDFENDNFNILVVLQTWFDSDEFDLSTPEWVKFLG
jgi:hypothetical protein